MPTEVILPDIGASPDHPIRLSAWFVDEGDFVYEGDRLVEVLVEGATFDVAAAATGRFLRPAAFVDQALEPGQVLGFIDPAEPDA